MVPENPFTPTFGEVPLYMAGRKVLLDSFVRAFDRQGRAPELTTLVSGARGTGKTALLTRIAEEAQAHGWVCANTTAVVGMLDDIVAQATDAASSLVNTPGSERHLTGIGIGQLVSLDWKESDSSPATWRQTMGKLVDSLAPYGSGLLITVDEVRPDLDEMVYLSAIYQHFVREHKRVALVMAGLPFNISSLLQDKTVSFLRRAQHQYLGRLPDFEIREALQKTVASSSRLIGCEALDHAVTAISGSPFMLQLVGYRMWDQHPESPTISLEDAVHGAHIASDEMRDRVLESTYRELSDGDLAFLRAMLPDRGDSSIRDIAERLGKSSAYTNTYRRRLLEQGVIGERRRGIVGFDLPAFKEFLEEKGEKEG